MSRPTNGYTSAQIGVAEADLLPSFFLLLPDRGRLGDGQAEQSSKRHGIARRGAVLVMPIRPPAIIHLGVVKAFADDGIDPPWIDAKTTVISTSS